MADFPKPDFSPISSPRISVFAWISLSDAIAANNLQLKRLQYTTKLPPDNSRCPSKNTFVSWSSKCGWILFGAECVLIPRWCYGDMPMISGKSSPAPVLMKAGTRSVHLPAPYHTIPYHTIPYHNICLRAQLYTTIPQPPTSHQLAIIPFGQIFCNHSMSNHLHFYPKLNATFCRGCAALWWGRCPVSTGTTWRTSWSWRTTWRT